MIRLVLVPLAWLTIIALATAAVLELDVWLEQRAFDRDEALAAARYVARRLR